MTKGTAGQPLTLTMNFRTQAGALADPDTVTLTITRDGGRHAGPFTYYGSRTPVPGQVHRTGTGLYACRWPIPEGTPPGTYTARWDCTHDGTGSAGTEDFTIGPGYGGTGGYTPDVPAGDAGYWTGGIIYGGLDIEFGQTDGNGTTWLWQKLTGWDCPPVQGAGVIPRSGDHGAWASPQYYAARTMTLTCTASARSQALRDVARAQLQQAVPVSDLATLRYDEPVPKVSYVRRSGAVTEAYPTLADVTFTVGLVAPDPRKYAATGKTITITPVPTGGGGGMVVPFTVPFTLDPGGTPGSSVAVNNGNFGSPPVAVITGPVTGPSLANLTTGNTVSWSTLTLGAGDIGVADFLNRQMWVNPTSISTVPGMPGPGGTYWPADVTSAWWDLEPGSSQVQLGGQTGSGCSAVVYFSDAWS